MFDRHCWACNYHMLPYAAIDGEFITQCIGLITRRKSNLIVLYFVYKSIRATWVGVSMCREFLYERIFEFSLT